MTDRLPLGNKKGPAAHLYRSLFELLALLIFFTTKEVGKETTFTISLPEVVVASRIKEWSKGFVPLLVYHF